MEVGKEKTCTGGGEVEEDFVVMVGGWLDARGGWKLRAGEESGMYRACLHMQLVILSCLLGEKRGRRTNLYVSCVTLNDCRMVL